MNIEQFQCKEADSNRADRPGNSCTTRSDTKQPHGQEDERKRFSIPGLDAGAPISCEDTYKVHVGTPCSTPANCMPNLATPALQPSSAMLGYNSSRARKPVEFALNAFMDDIDLSETPVQPTRCPCNQRDDGPELWPQGTGAQATPICSVSAQQSSLSQPGVPEVTRATLQHQSVQRHHVPASGPLPPQENHSRGQMQLQGSLPDAVVNLGKRQLGAQDLKSTMHSLPATPVQDTNACSDLCQTLGYAVDCSHLYKRRRCGHHARLVFTFICIPSSSPRLLL